MKKIIGAEPRDNSDNGPGRGATQVITAASEHRKNIWRHKNICDLSRKTILFVDNIASKPVAVHDAS